MRIWRDYGVCPYNKNHLIRNYNVKSHIVFCKEKHQNPFFVTCKFNSDRLCQEDPEFYCQTDSEDINTKSKRRRDKIKNRHILPDPMPNFLLQQNPSSERGAVKMDNKHELLDLDGGQEACGDLPQVEQESVKKKTPKKKTAQDSNDSAEPSPEAPEQLSKAARKRYLKKQKKLKSTADNVPAVKSEQEEKYVIKLNESVVVTETCRPRREVFIHYPTRRILAPESVPKPGFGIQPMMLQRICYEAFMKMQYEAEQEPGTYYLTAYGNEPASEDNSSVNEDDDKTTEDYGETASGITLSGFEKEILSEPGKLNADLYYPKRYKSKKEKKWHPQSKATASRNRGWSSSLQEFSLRERFAKFMISEKDVVPRSSSCPSNESFPPPYFEHENAVLSKIRQEWGDRSEPIDYDIQQFLCDYEWSDEKDHECMDENENATTIY